MRVVLDYSNKAGDFNTTKKAKLLFTDGSTKTVEVAIAAAQTPTINPTATPAVDEFNAYTNGKVSKYDIVSYTIGTDDVYELGSGLRRCRTPTLALPAAPSWSPTARTPS